MKKKCVLMLASVASMIDQFNMPNICLLQGMGYEVHVACNFRKGNTCDGKRITKLQKRLDGLGVRWFQWDCPRSLSGWADCLRSGMELLLLTKHYPYAFIHCHSPIGGAIARVVAHIRRIPVVYTAHGFHFFKGAPKKNWLLYYPVEKLLSYWTEVLVVLNKEDEQFARRNLAAKRVFRIPGVGVDVDRFQKKASHEAAPAREKALSVRVRYGIPEDAILLLSVGELSGRKNHTVVLEALAQMDRQAACEPDDGAAWRKYFKQKNIYYMICGQGPLETELLLQAKRAGLENRLCLTGYQPQVDEVYREADIFVFPSLQEGMPVALMEAMASGLPCVVSDIRGNRELIEKRGGGRFACAKPCWQMSRHVLGTLRGTGGGGSPTGMSGLEETGELQALLKTLLSDAGLRKACGRYNQKRVQAFGMEQVEAGMGRIYSLFGE